ncbi:MAG: thioredoxin family protein [Candidatus Moraniibacteriota bacterium]
MINKKNISDGVKIKILGTGCPNCKKLEDNVKQALVELKIDIEIEKITDIGEIMSYGVLSVPALLINEEVKVYGRVPATDEIKEILENNTAASSPVDDKKGGCCSCSCGGSC